MRSCLLICRRRFRIIKYSNQTSCLFLDRPIQSYLILFSGSFNYFMSFGTPSRTIIQAFKRNLIAFELLLRGRGSRGLRKIFFFNFFFFFLIKEKNNVPSLSNRWLKANDLWSYFPLDERVIVPLLSYYYRWNISDIRVYATKN